jgi:LytS/YehU family sensor histidine kinase
MTIDIITAYTLIYLTDKFLERKKYILLILLSTVVITFGIVMYRLSYFYLIIKIHSYSIIEDFWEFNILEYAYGLFFPVAMINILHLIRKWVSSQKEMYDISRAKIAHELSFLKIQLNQHFLFNTLNNIDSLIYSDPETASQTIVNLSNLLRYSIYETDVKRVPVKKEIDYIITFIELYELRLSDSNKIELKICGEYENLVIVPRLFIPFVENALIYGKKDDDSKIYISITFVENKVILNTMNQIKNIDFNKQGGVGIKNVRRTLDIVYPNKYNLEITNKDNWYIVKLTIELNDERNNELYYC